MKNAHTWLAAALGLVLLAGGCNTGRPQWQPPEKEADVKIAREDGKRSDATGCVVAVSDLMLEGEEGADGKRVILDADEAEFASFRASMQRKLKAYWQPLLEQSMYYNSGIEGQTVYTVSVNGDGRLVTSELVQGSGVVHYDVSAEEAIRHPYPGLMTEFEALPVGYRGQVLTVTITFHANPSTIKESR